MAKLTKTEIVRRYAEKNPTMTVRQMASDLDMAPAGVHQIMWTLRKRGEAPVSTRTNKKIALQQIPTITNTINEWEGTDPTKGFASAPVKNEGDKISYDISDTLAGAVLVRKIELLEEKVRNQTIIIQYLEKRLDEEKAKGS